MEKPFIIIADPSADRAAALEEALGPGCDCLAIRDVGAALREVRARRPAAVIVDFPFPGDEGQCLSEVLGDDPATAAVPVVAHSGWDFPRTRARAKSFGCRAFVPHQRGPDAVARAVEELLEGESEAVA